MTPGGRGGVAAITSRSLVHAAGKRERSGGHARKENVLSRRAAVHSTGGRRGRSHGDPQRGMKGVAMPSLTDPGLNRFWRLPGQWGGWPHG